MIHNPSTFIVLGITGAAFSLLGTLISAIAYRGKQGEAYSPFNHFISELGEVGVSRWAWAFNLGLILSGLCLIPAVVVVGLIMPGVIIKLGMVAGVITAVGLTLVGVFPMNKLKPHGIAALTFFRGGLLMVSLFSLAIALQPEAALLLPRAYSLSGLPPILAFGGFLIMMHKTSDEETDDPLQPVEVKRPKFWLMPTVEWTIFITIVLWFLLIALGLSR
ncbi:MAG: DUF998 domain-containing protein [Brevefilum sp.]